MTVFDGVSYSLSPSLSPTRKNELAAVLDLNGAAPHPPHTHLIAPAASHAHNNATNDPTVKLVTDRWVDRSVVMGKRQPEQYYSPDPAMVFSGVVACATDLSTADLEVLSAGITALGGQWRVGLTRDVTHLFALRTGSDKYNTALHFAPQTHMCILTPHWFDDVVRLGRRIPETPYSWPDPPVLRPGTTLDSDDDPFAIEGKRKRKAAANTGASGGGSANVGEHVRVWADRRILLSTSLELTDGSRGAIEARIQRAGGVVVPIPRDAEEDAEEKAVDEADVLVTRWRSGKSYFKAARASILIGTLSWLFSVESSGTLHSPLDSLLWYPTPRGGIPDLADCEISVTNYTGAARDYLKRLITLVGAKFTPSMSQSNKVLIAGFQPSPKTDRALSWSIPVVNHTWLEDCFVEWRALTVGLERYIVYPPGVDFGEILMTRHDGPPSSQSAPIQHLSGGAVPGGRGIGVINVGQEETRDAEHRAREGWSAPGRRDGFEKATTADRTSVIDGDVLTESRAQPRSRAGSVRRTPSSARVKRGSTSTPRTISATGAFIDHVIELPADDEGDNVDGKQRTPTSGRQRARTSSVGSRADVPRPLSAGLFSTTREAEYDTTKRRVQPTEHPEEEENTSQPVRHPNLKSCPVQRRSDTRTSRADADVEEQPPDLQRRVAKMTAGSNLDLHMNTDDGSAESMPPRKPLGAGSKTPVKSGMKPRPRSESQSKPQSVPGGESEEEVRMMAAESGRPTSSKKRQEVLARSTPKGGVTKEKGKETTKEEKVAKQVTHRSRSPTRSPSPTSPGMKNSCKPKRRLSVIVPSVPKEYFSLQDVREAEGGGDKERETREKRADTATSGIKRKQLRPAESSTSTNKRSKQPAEKATPIVVVTEKPKSRPRAKSGTSKTLAKARANGNEDVGEEEEDDDTSMMVDTPVASTSRNGPRRSAANNATTRLREEIMPDVVSFEKERKQAKRRRSAGVESAVPAREVGEWSERGGKRRKTAKEAEGEAAEEEEEEEARVEVVVSVPSVKAKRQSINGKGKVKGTTAVASDEDASNPPAKNKPSAPQAKDARGRGKESAVPRLMTTGVTLSDEVIKRLTKLGVQMTKKPMDCTHLVAKGIVRTEKFLCAMSVSPYILTEEWANASAKSGKLLSEHDYPLSDPAAERKWSLNFADAIARAKGREGGSNLFKQMTFYVTPKVSVDAKLLKNVISAGGGQVQISTMPTVRILNGKAKRYVISCPEDKGIWQPLVQEGFKVYSHELVLRAALRQEIKWEEEECLVAG